MRSRNLTRCHELFSFQDKHSMLYIWVSPVSRMLAMVELKLLVISILNFPFWVCWKREIIMKNTNCIRKLQITSGFHVQGPLSFGNLIQFNSNDIYKSKQFNNIYLDFYVTTSNFVNVCFRYKSLYTTNTFQRKQIVFYWLCHSKSYDVSSLFQCQHSNFILNGRYFAIITLSGGEKIYF